MIYADFESILVPEDNGNHKHEEYKTSKYQRHAASSCDYKLVCVEYNFSHTLARMLLKTLLTL